jgi:glucose-6-phosphate-specific signal transduction histidine kinase
MTKMEHSPCTESGQVQNLNQEFKDTEKLRSKLCNWAVVFRVYKIWLTGLLSRDLKTWIKLVFQFPFVTKGFKYLFPGP